MLCGSIPFDLAQRVILYCSSNFFKAQLFQLLFIVHLSFIGVWNHKILNLECQYSYSIHGFNFMTIKHSFWISQFSIFIYLTNSSVLSWDFWKISLSKSILILFIYHVPKSTCLARRLSWETLILLFGVNWFWLSKQKSQNRYSWISDSDRDLIILAKSD